jgi:hypothetical protein
LSDRSASQNWVVSQLERYAPRAPSAEPAWRASKAHQSLGRLAAF